MSSKRLTNIRNKNHVKSLETNKKNKNHTESLETNVIDYIENDPMDEFIMKYSVLSKVENTINGFN
jgi:hypothetical protein